MVAVSLTDLPEEILLHLLLCKPLVVYGSGFAPLSVYGIFSIKGLPD